MKCEKSVAELITQIYIGIEIEYIERNVGMQWVRESNELLRMLKGLQQHIQKKIS